MTRKLDHHAPSSPTRGNGVAALAILAPLVALPLFVVSTVALQDGMVNGDGRSWLRAALVSAALPLLLTAGGIAGGFKALNSDHANETAAIVAVVLNVLALFLILLGILTA